MTTQTMTNELTLNQLDIVSGAGPAEAAATLLDLVAKVIDDEVITDALGKLADAIDPNGVMVDESGNGDYRPGPQSSPNSPPNPFG
ncbi:MAG: hypothetical protein AAF572_02560 [Cyanobacteria bacterium P01_B01_bin.77]